MTILEKLNFDFSSQDDQELHGKYLIFCLDDDEYGMEISKVTEIVVIQSITHLPKIPHYIKGIMNLRGRVLPVMDIRVRFNKESLGYTDRNCIIVANIKDTAIGMIVDTVVEVIKIDDDQIVPAPGNEGQGAQKYIKSIGKTAQGSKMLIDCEGLFDDDLDEPAINL